jgi:hypothetical protein
LLPPRGNGNGTTLESARRQVIHSRFREIQGNRRLSYEARDLAYDRVQRLLSVLDQANGGAR